MPRLTRLPLIPLAIEVQLVLGLPLGIRTKRNKRRVAWLRPTGRAA